MSAEATTTEHTNPFDVPEKAAHESNPGEGTSDPLAVSANRLLDERRAGQPWTEERQGRLAKLEAALTTMEPAQNDLEGAKGQPVGEVIEALRKDLNKTHPELGLRVTSDWTSEPTEREWLSPDWLPSGRVSMLTGTAEPASPFSRCSSPQQWRVARRHRSPRGAERGSCQ